MKSKDFKDAIYAGILAGLLFMVTEIVLTHIFTENSTWTMPRMTASLVLGRNVLPPAASFDLGIVLTGLLVHLTASALFSVFLSMFIHLSNLVASILVGFTYGLMLYFITFNLLGNLFYWPQTGNWIHLISSILYGGAVGLLFKELQRKHHKCHNC